MSKASVAKKFDSLINCLTELREIENQLADDGIKIGLISLAGRRSFEDWSVYFNAGIDKAADCLKRTAAVQDAGIKPIKRKEFKYHGVTFVQHPKDNPTDIYE